VKDLAKEFKMRIEMRQVGVRDEAKMVRGFGVWGRSLCCFSFMKSFEPVTIQKAKKQQIVINPTKISGLCGRLMCCLAFEDETLGRLYAEEEKVEED
jgi:cell fate regulator YaaT (PSP1 superfamily)